MSCVTWTLAVTFARQQRLEQDKFVFSYLINK